MPERDLVPRRGHRRERGPFVELGALGGVRRDLDRLVEERHRLALRAQREARSAAPQRDAGLGGQRLRLGPSAGAR